MRLFIAIDLSKELRKRLSDHMDQLSQLLGTEAIRWVNPSNVHLTLKFLGETPEDQVDRLKNTLKNIAPQIPVFEMWIGEFGCFPNLRRPRVFWIGVHEESGSLRELHSLLETEFEKMGFKKERRPFTAHLTLGRIMKKVGSSALQTLSKRLEAVQIEELGTEIVQEVCLFQSELRPTGAVYTQLGRFRLRGAE